MTGPADRLDPSQLEARVFDSIRALLDDKSTLVAADTPLIGDGRIMDSMKLVELCLSLEDIASDAGFEFDWTSEAAMSRSRGMFRTAGALAAAFVEQAGASA
jgi:hypothetical protein